MSHSYAQPAALTCSRCKKDFEAAIWLVVDGREQPDLIERLRGKRLHQPDCPHCGTAAEPIDAPVVVYRPDHPGLPLLFVPARHTTADEDEAHKSSLLTYLHDALAGEWDDKWVRPLNSVSHELVAYVLDAAESNEDVRDAIPVLEAINRLLDSRSWNDARRSAAASAPLLLTPLADRLLVARAREQVGTTARRAIETYRALLERSRTVGVAAAFADRIGTDDPMALPEDVRRVKEALAVLMGAKTRAERTAAFDGYEQELLSPAADDLLEEFAVTLDRSLTETIRQYQRLIDIARREGSGMALALREWQAAGLEASPEHARAEEILRVVRGGLAAEDYEQVAREAREGLEIVDRQAHPEVWATLQLGLAEALRQMKGLAWHANLEESIVKGVECLRIFTRRHHPRGWAGTLSNLCEAYYNRTQGDRRENLECAIACGRLALRVYTREAMPDQWAGCHHNLANAYMARIVGVRARNVERAIACFNRTVEVRTRESAPLKWAVTQNGLGNAWLDRIEGDAADNIESAIACFERALEVQSRENTPDAWAMTQNNLGTAWHQRLRGDRADNLEQAIACFNRSLEVYTLLRAPVDWAQTQLNLGNVYLKRPRGRAADNCRLAREHYERACEVFRSDTYPMQWATVQTNLAEAYEHAARDASDYEHALRCQENALTIWTREADEERWAVLQVNLGATYLRRNANGGEDIERAIEHHGRALTVFTEERDRQKFAFAQQQLGLDFSRRRLGDAASNRRTALEHLHRALPVWPLNSFPSERAKTLRHIGDVHFEGEEWELARAAYAEAVDAGDLVFEAAYTEVGRYAEAGDIARVYSLLAYCLVRLGRIVDALLTIERGMTRVLASVLVLADLELVALSEDERRSLVDARARVQALEAEMRLPLGERRSRGDAELGRALQQARAELTRVTGSIRASHPDLWPAPLDERGVLALIPPGGALVVPLVTPAGGAVLLLPHGDGGGTPGELDPSAGVGVAHVVSHKPAHVVPLPELTTDRLTAILVGSSEKPGWLLRYSAWRDGAATDHDGSGDEAWDAAITSITKELWDVIMGPVRQGLLSLGIGAEAGAPVTMVSQGWLGLLPLHAAWRECDGTPRSFLDDYVVSYTPSLGVLRALRQRRQQPRRQTRTLLAIVDPTHDLAHSRAEGEAVAALFPPDARHLLVGDAATLAGVESHAPAASYLHFACHGLYRWGDVMQSGLRLADGFMTLADVHSPRIDLSRTRLVTLSACESGLFDFAQSEEYVGLPAAFLQAGAPCVVSCLWPVDDQATGLLMQRFYEAHLKEGLDVASAVRAAQLWLRDQLESSGESFAHPFYWAAFTCTGA